MKTTTPRSVPFQFMPVAVVCLWMLSVNAVGCELDTRLKDATVEEIAAFFQRENKYVVTFVGYSGSGYEDQSAMIEIAGNVLDKFDTATTIVNIGATPDGIGAVYELAHARGFNTTGIVSSQAKKYAAGLSPCVEHAFYVEDSTWGGFTEGTDQLSPTSQAMVENSDVLIGIGGGGVGRDELLAAKKAGKEVRFFAADMNHKKARDKALKKGLPEPTDFSGAASSVF